MPSTQHGRQYDVVIFGATGYTGKLTAQHVAAHFPTNMKWAVAGRSRAKLQSVADKCECLNADGQRPAIEVCSLDEADLSALAQKTFVLVTTVGPFGKYGEGVFRACAHHGTHYVDATGEVPWVARMIRRYEETAKQTGAILVPQCGVESAVADVLTWVLAAAVRELFDGAPVSDVVVSLHDITGAPSGGTLATLFTLFDVFTLSELRRSMAPYALSPVAPPARGPGAASPLAPPPRSLLRALTGLLVVPGLGLQTTAPSARADAPIVQRTWGLLASEPALRAARYGPRFAWRMHMRARGRLHGAAVHLALAVLALLLASPLRHLARRLVSQPGDGPSDERARDFGLEVRGLAAPDVDGAGAGGGRQVACCRARYQGSAYHLTAVLMAEAARTLLEGDHNLEHGGVYTPASLGQGYVDRLDGAGFHLEKGSMTV